MSQIKIIYFFLHLMTNVLLNFSVFNYHLHQNDEFALKLVDYLSYDDFLNDLKIESSNHPNQIEIDIPQYQTEQQIEHFYPDSSQNPFEIEEIYFQDNQQNFISSLIRTNKENNVILISEFNKNQDQQISTLNSKYLNVGDDLKCYHLKMDQTNIYLVCKHQYDQQLRLYTKNYKDNTSISFINIDFQFDINEEISNKIFPKIDIINNQEANKILAVYFKNSEIPELMNKFVILKQKSIFNYSVQLEGFKIHKIQLINYNIVQNELSMIISSSKSDSTKSIYHLKIVGDIIDNSLLKPYDVENLISFDYYKEIVILYQEISQGDTIKITELNIINMDKRSIEITNQKKFVRADMGNNLAVLQTENLDDEQEFYFYDIDSQRILKSIKNYPETYYWKISSFYNQNCFYAFDFADKEWKMDLLNFPNSIKIKNISDVKETTILLKIKEKIVSTINIKYLQFENTFSTIKNSYILQKERKNEIKLYYYKNNMRINQSNVEYFDQLKINKERINCYPQKLFYSKNYFLYFCDGNKIISYQFIYQQNKQLFLQDPKVILQDTQLNFNNIQAIKLYYNQVIVILTNDMTLYWFDIRNEKFNSNFSQIKLQRKTLDQEYQDCRFNQEGLICLKEQNTIYLIFSLKRSDMYITELDLNQEENTLTLMNSYFDAFYKILLQQNIFDGKTYLKGCKQFCDYQVEIKKNSQNLQFYEITKNNYLIINNDSNNNVLFYGLIEESIIQYPIENYLKNFKEIELINTYPEENLFVIFYRTLNNILRAALYKSTLLVSQRLIQEFIVDDKGCEKFSTFANSNQQGDFLIYFLCSEIGNENEKVWSFKIDGPLINIKGNDLTSTISVDGEELKLNFTYYEKKSFLKVQNKNLKIGVTDKNDFIQDMEKDNYISIKGDLFNCKLMDNVNGIELMPRAYNIKTNEIFDELEKTRNFENIQSFQYNETYNLLFDNFLYSQNSYDYYESYSTCIYIKSTYLTEYDNVKFQKLFLCRDKINYSYYITNFQDINTQINNQYLESNLKAQKAFLIKVNKIIYLIISCNENHRFIKIIKIFQNVDDDDFKVVSSKSYNSMNLTDDNIFSEFFVTYFNEIKNIIFCFHPKYSSDFIFVNYPIQKDEIDLKTRTVLPINTNDRDMIKSSKFFINKTTKNLGLFYTTNNNLFEIEVKFSDQWNYTQIQKWNNFSGNMNKNEIIFNSNYVGVILSEFQIQKVLIWKRNQFGQEDISQIFTSIGSLEIKEPNFKIVEVSILDDDKDILYFVYYSGQKENSNTFKTLKLKQFELNNLRLKFQLDQLRYKEIIKFRFFSFQEFVDIPFEIQLKNNYKVFIFTIFLCILFLIMLSLLALVINLFRGNQSLKSELEKDLREHETANLRA